MRDIALTLVIIGSIPYILMRPFVGIVMWTWLAYFNPQKMTYGFALQMPYSMLIGGITLVAWLFSGKEPKKLPLNSTTIIWLLFIVWMILTTIFAIQPEDAQTQLVKVLKIQIFSLLTLLMLTSWERIRTLTWCIVLSIGYFAVKGAIWVFRTGGSSRVWGPTGTFIEGNNELALATLMTIPLAVFLYTTETVVWRKRALLAGALLAGFSVAGSFSRGAFLAAVAMSLFLTWRSKNRFAVGFAVAIVGISVFTFMPDSWTQRLETIKTYRDDGSAMKRVNTWKMAWNFTLDHPMLGGGYEMFLSREAYEQYADRSDKGWIFQDAHSNYLKVLAEHGFPGLILFLTLFASGWRRASKVVVLGARAPPDSPEAQMASLARMCQASIVAYFVGGAFLGLCYFDLPYNILGFCIALSVLSQKAQSHNSVSVAASSKVGPTGPETSFDRYRPRPKALR